MSGSESCRSSGSESESCGSGSSDESRRSSGRKRRNPFSAVESKVNAFEEKWSFAGGPSDPPLEAWGRQKLLSGRPVDIEELDRSYSKVMDEIRQLRSELRRDYANHDRYAQLDSRMGSRMQFVFYVKELMRVTLEATTHATPNDGRGAPSICTGSEYRFSAQTSDTKLTSVQSCTLFALQEAHQRCYRRYKGAVWKPLYVSRSDGRRVPTRAWTRKFDTIEAFVSHAVDKEHHFNQWQNATSAMNATKHCAEELGRGRHTEMPDLVPDRHVFAFRNGVYVINSPESECGVFFHIDEDNYEAETEEYVACNFIDVDFDVDLTTDNGDDEWDWYTHLKTPAFQQILNFQFPEKSQEATIRWAYVMVGRMLYEIGEMDGWQVIAFFKGVAGSGKSTIGQVMQSIYRKEDVGILSSNTEETFGLSAIADKFIWTCLEVKESFRLNQADLQSMITGEDVVVAKKHETATSKRWTAQGMLFGNQGGGWTEAGNAMGRRLLVWEFDKKVPEKESNPNLPRELQSQIGTLLFKINVAYLAAVREYGDKNLWSVLPEYFKGTQRRMKAQTDALQAFLQDEGTGIKIGGDDTNMELVDFKTQFSQWAKTNGYRVSRWNSDFYGPVFNELGIETKSGTLYGIYREGCDVMQCSQECDDQYQ